jgi:hypothetical protein
MNQKTASVDAPCHRIFLLSPANANGKRAQFLLNPRAEFDLAVRLRRGQATLGETYAFISGLYFRGKLAYASAFAAPPDGAFGSLIITPGRGLVRADTLINLDDMQQISAVPVDLAEVRYRIPLERDCRTLRDTTSHNCKIILLGSLATPKYLATTREIFGSQLQFPEEFVGRGDLSRGGLMLRCVRSGTHLTYVAASETHTTNAVFRAASKKNGSLTQPA